jgi:hypothetical protein
VIDVDKEQKIELEKQLKAAMGYTELNPVMCKDCEYYSSEESLYEDRALDSFCDITPIKRIKVKPDARCNAFEPKPTKKGD